MSGDHRAATQRRRKISRRGFLGSAGVALAALAAALILTGAAAAAAVCGARSNPPVGGSYGQFNVPPSPGIYFAYYSFWDSVSPYYARRRYADGTISYESLRTSGGMWDFANCSNGTCSDPPRRTQLQNSNGASGWGWTIEAWNTTSQANC